VPVNISIGLKVFLLEKKYDLCSWMNSSAERLVNIEWLYGFNFTLKTSGKKLVGELFYLIFVQAYKL
jgi:hypothetical protein